MVTEKELIGKIGELRQIRPRKDWVVLTKSQILGEEPKVLFFPFFKPVLATVTAFGILLGIFSLAQNSLPGDFLYSIKKITEKGQAVFVSEEEKPAFQLKLANERLEDLTKAPAKNLAPTIKEYQASVSEAAKNLTKIKDPEKAKKVVMKIQELEEKKREVEILGVVVGETKTEDEDSNLTTSQIIEWQIQYWEGEGETLSKEAQEWLVKANKYYEAGPEYYNLASEALEKIYLLSYPQE